MTRSKGFLADAFAVLYLRSIFYIRSQGTIIDIGVRWFWLRWRLWRPMRRGKVIAYDVSHISLQRGRCHFFLFDGICYGFLHLTSWLGLTPWHCRTAETSSSADHLYFYIIHTLHIIHIHMFHIKTYFKQSFIRIFIFYIILIFLKLKKKILLSENCFIIIKISKFLFRRWFKNLIVSNYYKFLNLRVSFNAYRNFFIYIFFIFYLFCKINYIQNL